MWTFWLLKDFKRITQTGRPGISFSHLNPAQAAEFLLKADWWTPGDVPLNSESILSFAPVQHQYYVWSCTRQPFGRMEMKKILKVQPLCKGKHMLPAVESNGHNRSDWRQNMSNSDTSEDCAAQNDKIWDRSEETVWDSWMKGDGWREGKRKEEGMKKADRPV